MGNTAGENDTVYFSAQNCRHGACGLADLIDHGIIDQFCVLIAIFDHLSDFSCVRSS